MTLGIGVINSNASAIFTNRILDANNRVTNSAVQKLSSGLRINKAADDAAGLAVSEKMRGQISGLEQALTNVQDATSMAQTAEGVLDVANSIMIRMRQLAVQSANDNYTNQDRKEIQKELDQLIDQVDRVANYTEFNTKALLNGDTIGLVHSEDSKVATGQVVGDVQDADYLITILDAGTASNVHGSANLSDTDGDGKIILKDAGIDGDAELHITIDDNTRIIDVNENDSLYDLVRRINEENVGVLAGLDQDQNDITLTSVHSGSRFNISFGDDPDGVALKLGFYGGADLSRTKVQETTEDNGQTYKVFTTGTDTIISIANVTHQTMFPTIPGRSNEAGGEYQSLGVFRSNSDIFTEKELSDPIGGDTLGPAEPTLGNPNMEQSNLLKGLVIRIDEQLDYGVNQITNDDDSEGDFTGNYPIDTEGVNSPDYRAQVPEEREVIGTDAESWASITQVQLRVRANKQKFHIGANEGQIFSTSFGNITPEALGLAVKLTSDGKVNLGKTSFSTGVSNAGPLYQMNLSVQTQKSAEHALGVIDKALNKISSQRAALGGIQNSLEKTYDYIMANELQASESRIRDADMAKQMMNLTKGQVLGQSAVAMLAQANSKSETILSLIR